MNDDHLVGYEYALFVYSDGTHDIDEVVRAGIKALHAEHNMILLKTRIKNIGRF